VVGKRTYKRKREGKKNPHQQIPTWGRRKSVEVKGKEQSCSIDINGTAWFRRITHKIQNQKIKNGPRGGKKKKNGL